MQQKISFKNKNKNKTWFGNEAFKILYFFLFSFSVLKFAARRKPKMEK
jgi:hypothetical protein